MAGVVGLADLGDDGLGGFLGDFGDGELEKVAFGDGGVEAGTGVQVHQLADDGQAQVGEKDFGGDGLRLQHDEAGGADVLVLVRGDDGAESADGTDGGGDDVALVNLLAGTAGGFIGGRGFAGGGTVAAQAADLDVVEAVGLVLSGIKGVVTSWSDILNGQAVGAEFGEQHGHSHFEYGVSSLFC